MIVLQRPIKFEDVDAEDTAGRVRPELAGFDSEDADEDLGDVDDLGGDDMDIEV